MSSYLSYTENQIYSDSGSTEHNNYMQIGIKIRLGGVFYSVLS